MQGLLWMNLSSSIIRYQRLCTTQEQMGAVIDAIFWFCLWLRVQTSILRAVCEAASANIASYRSNLIRRDFADPNRISDAFRGAGRQGGDEMSGLMWSMAFYSGALSWLQHNLIRRQWNIQHLVVSSRASHMGP